MKPLDQLVALRSAFKALDDVEWEGARFSGSTELDDTIREVLGTYSDSITVYNKSGIQMTDTQVERLSNGEMVHLEVEFPIGDSAFFARDIDMLIATQGYGRLPPEAFYVASIDYLWRGETDASDAPQDEVSNYLVATKIICELERLADHVDNMASPPVLVFLTPEHKLEIPITYSASDLTEAEGFLQSLNYIDGNGPSVAHRGILKNVLNKHVSTIAPSQRFGALLRDNTELTKSYNRDVELFTANFSFDNEKEKLMARKRSYILEINRTVGDIQTKLLAIPISLVLVGGQLELSTTREQCIANSAILLGAFVFALLMYLLAHVQWSSLDTISTELESRQERWALELPQASTEVKAAFGELKNRVNYVRFLQVVILSLVTAGLAFIIWLYFQHTPNIFPWLCLD